jgi:ribosomal protein L7/L12
MSEIDYGARAHLDYIETQLQALFPDSYVPFAEVALARAGNMIAAIKEYRSITGAGLAEAKQAVEAIR